MLRRKCQRSAAIFTRLCHAVPPHLAPIPPIGQSTGVAIAGPNQAISTVKVLPLALVEEVPLAPTVLTEIELIMRAWSEEHARQLFKLTLLLRSAIFVCVFSFGYLGYRAWMAAERRLRGADYMPSGLRIGSVVYLDMSCNGREVGRIVVGLLNENCPLYCEYFHRRCTGSGGTGESFRGLKMPCLIVRNVAIFGDGVDMTHEVPGYAPGYLPTEYKAEKPWRGCLTSIAYGPNRESPNFAIHMASGDYSPQVFGLVIGGYEVLDKMNQVGTNHGCDPRQEWFVEGCGELCTLDKSKIVPLPWQLYETISKGFDQDKFGPIAIASRLWNVGPAAVKAAVESVTDTKPAKRWLLF